ncbi:hypothetical protein FisN_21Lh167 [Fistulifera solaris]|uniref:MIF4G-like type 1 domain-containing protein n=1 Tax=Fistulifera solaris TaxID=1519565 RepID=A0A1Z5J903_FISSO|nr:hypothetical protein FisN_21Lh167 [Fistulifera solaris]|eukprot:GAX10470.1 hypothetical protein FisN_21Lh167 [Fistulifera solaris]
MDRPLSSDRRDERRDFSSDRQNNHYGHGGRGRHHNNYRGRSNYRGRGRGYSSSHHQHHQQQYHPYRRGGFQGGGRGAPRRETGNRFQADVQEQDPKLSALRQLQQLINKVGELEVPSSVKEEGNQRPVVVSQTEKIKALTSFLCGPQAEMFLEYERDASVVQADKLAGPFVSSLIHCQSVLPLQTPCYAALTLSVHEHTTVCASPFAGVSDRCVEYALRFLARDLDHTLLDPACLDSNTSAVAVHQDRPRAVVRMRLTLRYIANLAKMGIVAAQDTNDQSAVLAATNQRPITLLDLLDAMVQAAIQAGNERYSTNKSVACILAHLVWDTIPYIRDMVSSDWISENLVDPLQETMEAYQSAFAPGIGSSSILLKAERYEDVGETGDEEDEEEDDDEEDDSGAVCDSFQDLLRTLKHSLGDNGIEPRFALFTDAPWQAMSAPVTQNIDGTAGAEQSAEESSSVSPLTFSGQAVSLQLFPTCRALTMLLGGDVAPETKLAKTSLDAIVVGRLPIFGPPPEAKDEDDEEMEDDTPVNERLHCYRQKFGIVDRFFIGEAVRDCLLCHESTVTPTGVEHGSPTGVAEQIWALRHVLTGQDAMGIEYCIVEVILSLITQGDRGSSLRVMYLSRVLLELTRLEPAAFSPAIALGVSTLFEDYMPALVPVAVYNLSKWFAFHLTNTDYQWPSAYWKHWEQFVLYGWSNSRGSFVKSALALMLENVSNVDSIVTDCLPTNSAIAGQLILPPELIIDAISSFAEELASRIWGGSLDSDMLLNHMLSEEFSESLASSPDNKFGRIKVLFGALLSPAKKSWKVTKNQIKKAINREDLEVVMVARDRDPDPLSLILEKMDKLKHAIAGVLEKAVAEGTIAHGVDPIDSRDLLILELIMDSTSYSRSVVEGCVMHCLRLNHVSLENILKWCLGAASDGSTKSLVLRWWHMAGEVLKTGLSLHIENVLSSKSDAMSGGDELDDKVRLVKSSILGYLDPLLSHMIQRVCQLLNLYKSEKSTKLSPEQVDLIEGFKYVLTECQGYYFTLVARFVPNNFSTNDLQDALTESPISGQSLAMLMDTSGSLAADYLRQSLERM